jgi:hypothetical protein
VSREPRRWRAGVKASDVRSREDAAGSLASHVGGKCLARAVDFELLRLEVGADRCHGLAQVSGRAFTGAFVNFFEGRAAYPRFRREFVSDSFRFPDPAQIKLLPSRHGWVVLPKLKWVRFRQSRPLPVAGRLLFATVSRTGEHWYVSFQCEVEIADPVCPGSDVVGIDLGVANSITLSAEVIQFPKFTATEQEKLAILDRRVASKQKGSSTDARRSPVDTPTTASLQTVARTHSTKPRPCSPSATASS